MFSLQNLLYWTQIVGPSLKKCRAFCCVSKVAVQLNTFEYTLFVRTDLWSNVTHGTQSCFNIAISKAEFTNLTHDHFRRSYKHLLISHGYVVFRNGGRINLPLSLSLYSYVIVSCHSFRLLFRYSPLLFLIKYYLPNVRELISFQY